MIQRMSDQHKIHFLDEVKESKNEKKTGTSSQKTISQLAEEQKAKKLEHKDSGLMTSQHVSSARTGAIKDEGGPSKYVKSESSNTIWDNDKTAIESQKIDSKTKTIQDKSEIASNKREAEDKRMNDLAESLKSTIQEKASSISPAGMFSGTNYKISDNNMSIFDSKDFMRVKDQTEGEKVSEETNARRGEVDDSWRGGGKPLSSQEITKKLFDGMFSKPEE